MKEKLFLKNKTLFNAGAFESMLKIEVVKINYFLSICKENVKQYEKKVQLEGIIFNLQQYE